ncbi:MAG: hypothetical protein R2939_06110 [Kofleriaceae bacterium]
MAWALIGAASCGGADGSGGIDAGPGDDVDAMPGTLPDAGPAPELPGVTNPQDVIDAVNARLPAELQISFLGVPTGEDLDAERARRGPRRALVEVDEITTSGPGEIIVGVDAAQVGTIHPGTIIIDSRIRDGTSIEVGDVVLAHVEITDPDAGNLLVTRDASDGLIVVNSYFHDSDADCFRPNDNETYLGNFVERLGRGPDSHADGFQTFFSDGSETIDNVDILANIIWMPRGVPIAGGGEYQTNRTMLFSNDVVDWVVAYNYLVAGNFAVEREASDDIRFLHNVFCHPDECDSFGIRTGGPWTTDNWAGNTYKDGSPAPAD